MSEKDPDQQLSTLLTMLVNGRVGFNLGCKWDETTPWRLDIPHIPDPGSDSHTHLTLWFTSDEQFHEAVGEDEDGSHAGDVSFDDAIEILMPVIVQGFLARIDLP